MSKQHDKSLHKRFFSSPLFIIVVLFVAVLFGFSYVRSYIEEYSIKKEIKQLEEEVGQLEKKKLESLEILEYVMSQDFLEERARVELGMKKPGEQVLVITNELQGEEIVVIEEPKHSNISNPKKWWYYFTHKSFTE